MESEADKAASDVYHVCLGCTYFVIGITGIILNAHLIKVFIRHQPMKSRGLLHINLAVANIAIVSGFVLTGTAHFKQRWSFPDIVCQGYSLLSMLSGTAEILTVMLISFDVYVAVCWPKLSKSLTAWHYYALALPAIWMTSLFWSVLPFYGWGSYSLDPAGTTCLVSWQVVDQYYAFYIMNYTSWCCIIPLAILFYLQSLISATLKQRDDKNVDPAVWFSDEQMSKLGCWFRLLTPFRWSLFGFVWLAVFVVEPNTIPKWLSTMVPLLAKIISISYPISYSILSPRFRDAYLGISDDQTEAKPVTPAVQDIARETKKKVK